ncbi:inositol monophosphatase family protein [Cobetia sp. MC34]|uniref:inositol monophosphatase family protein n=1 Tax=Cobetia sp. MC34 TaxID=2785080 RepID=UPI001BCA2A4D|nr:inositol monophosphatase family protein [Cobetia sp. MC34]MBS4154776.1 inositol monophosphatase [Cobetia sp. MC34]
MSELKLLENIVEKVSFQLDEICALRQDFTKKEDDSFVSKGDLLVQDIVVGLVKKYLPEHDVISEEDAPFTDVSFDDNGSYVIIDPIDGTENFVSGLKEWGVGVSIYTDGKHMASLIHLPEINDYLMTGMKTDKYKSRIIGLSSSLQKSDLLSLPDEGFEYRIIGCSMYNMLSAVRGAYVKFENVKGVNCWDVLPGLNLALEHDTYAEVDDAPYRGQILFPTQKYKIKLSSEGGL